MEHDPRIGAVLQERYRIVERIAEGGMGVVYRGERIGLERIVAIKFLHESVTMSSESRRRFEVEARAASRLAHPNCVAVVDFGVDRDSPFLVMEFVAGVTLRDVLKEWPLDLERSLRLATQLLAGLAHAHAHGIIHRDIKPDNILISNDDDGERARVIDFGLAKLTGASTITDGVAVGTPSYMSPEQTLGERADARSDVYGAGVLVFELLAGRKPFRADNPYDVMRKHREDPVPRFEDVAPGRAIPAEVEDVVARALAKEPADRYPSAVEFARALEAAYPPTQHASAVIDDIERPHYRRIVAAGIGVLAVGIATWFVFGRNDGTTSPERSPTVVEVALDASASLDVAPNFTAPTPGVSEALELAKTDPARAVAALDELRATHPENSDISRALGAVNADRAWWSAAVDAYADAIQKQPTLKTDERVVHDLVQALRSPKAHERAETLIVAVLGDSARSALEAASRTGATPQLRERAARLLGRLPPPPPRHDHHKPTPLDPHRR